MSMDLDPNAARRFYGEVRKFAEAVKPWQVALWHEIAPDEVWDATLVSERVYGRRDEFLAVLAACGLDMFDQPLPLGRRIAFPTEITLLNIKRQTGFESIAQYRESGKPTWVE
jgi:hypothetical protein